MEGKGIFLEDKKIGILQKISINYDPKKSSYWTRGEIIINGYKIEIEPKWDIKTLDKAVKDIKERITEAALNFNTKVEIK